jgi:hypothetical protein
MHISTEALVLLQVAVSCNYFLYVVTMVLRVRDNSPLSLPILLFSTLSAVRLAGAPLGLGLWEEGPERYKGMRTLHSTIEII